MNLRLVTSFLAAIAIVYLAGSSLGAAVTPAQPKIIATVVAHPHPVAHLYAPGSAHGL